MMRLVYLVIAFCGLYLTISGQVTADFEVDETRACSFVQANFTDLSTSSGGRIISWNWELGNTTSRTQNPSRIFGRPGSYTVCLTVTDDMGNQNRICKDDLIIVFDTLNPAFNLSDSLLCTGQQTVIYNRSNSVNGDIVEWRWDVNGSLGSKVDRTSIDSFVNQYNAPGSYDITLSIKDDKGCIGSRTVKNAVKVVADPSPNPQATNPQICELPHTSSINFSPEADFIYTWKFSNGVQYTGINPPDITVNTYEALDLILVYELVGGCLDSLQFNNFIAPGHEVLPQVTAYRSCTGARLQFRDDSPGLADSTLWNFGDGNFSTQKNPNHIYTSTGSFQASLSRLVNGCWITIPVDSTIQVYESPTADYSSSRTVGCFESNFIPFSDLSTGAVEWNWTFGSSAEFGQSMEQNPQVIFDEFGDFPVTLTVTSADGCSATVTKDTIRIFEFEPAISPAVTGCVPLNIHLEEVSETLSPTNDWLWRITGDTNLVYATQAIDFRMITAGQYNVSLIVSNEAGCVDSIRFDNYILGGNTPSVNFTVDTTIGCAETLFLFNDTTSAEVNIWRWLFSDGSRSNMANPTKKFSQPGFYDVKLEAGYNGCFSTRTYDSLIQVLDPLARFSFDYNCNGNFINFFNNSIGADSLAWDFGVIGTDSDTSSQANPAFVFPGPGVYMVSLTAYNFATGCTHTRSASIETFGPVINLSVDTTLGCAPLIVNVMDSSQFIDTTRYIAPGGLVRRRSSNGSMFIRYTRSGTYPPILAVVRDLNGCVDTILISDSIRVDGVDGHLIHFPALECNGQLIPVQFDDTSYHSDLNPISWKNDDLDWALLGQDSVMLNAAGRIPLRFALSNVNGCIDTIQDTIKVRGIQARFSADTIGCTFSPNQFLDQSIGQGLSFRWLFSNGDTSTLPDPRTLFTEENEAWARLIITDEFGCMDSVQHNLVIADPVPFFTVDSAERFCPPLEGIFNNQSENATRFEWEFGDSSAISFQENPVHIYNDRGTYNVTLTAGHLPGCTVTQRFDEFIRVGGPDGFFRATRIDASTCSPVDIRLNANFDGIYDLVWDYGDGNTTRISKAILSYQDTYSYNSTGVFRPSVIIEDSLGCKIAFSDELIPVDLLETDFSFSEDTICEGQTPISFFNLSKFDNPSVTFEWSIFNQDTSITTSDIEPILGNIPPGRFHIQLKGQSGQCIDSTQALDAIIVGVVPQATIGASSLTACDPHLVQFADLTPLQNINVAQRNWFNTSDEYSTNDSSFSKTYLAGLDTISLMVETVLGCKDSSWQVIETLPHIRAILEDTVRFCVAEPGALLAELTDVSVTSDYAWRSDPDLTCTQCLETNALPTSDKYYYFQTIHNNGCPYTDSVYFQLKNDTAPIIQLDSPLDICRGGVVQLITMGHQSDYRYDWDSTEIGLNCYTDCFNPVATPVRNTTYQVNVTNQSGCVYQDSVEVMVTQPVAQFAGADTTICQGNSLQLLIPTGMQHKWHTPDGLSCADCRDPIARPNTNMEYVVSMIDSQNCLAWDTLSVRVIEPGEVSAGMDTTVCIGGEITLNGTGVGTLSWFSAQPIVGNPIGNQITIAPQQSGYYFMRSDTSGCSLLDSVWIDVTDQVSATIRDGSVCIGDTLILTVEGSLTSVNWSSNEIEPIDFRSGRISPNRTGSYEAIVSFSGCVSDTVPFNIIVHEYPNVNIPNQLTYFDQPIQLMLNPSPSIQYTWTPVTGISCINCSDPILFPPDSITEYIVEARDLLTGCTITQTVPILKLASCGEALVGVPNVFSPNGDGINDELVIHTSLQQIDLFEIFDRWGNQLFRTSDKSIGWDGTLGNTPKQPDTYVYRLLFTCPSTNEQIEINGDITLVW